MNHQQGLNPYAPSELRDSAPAPFTQDSGRVPTLGVLAVTWGGIVLSGASFGMMMGGFIALLEPASLTEVMLLLPLGLFVGGVIAAISSIPVVLISLCLAAPLVPLAKGWRPRQARRFSTICGFVSGGAPIVLVNFRDPTSWFAALIPGIFGAVGASLFTRWMLGAANRQPGKRTDHTLVEDSIDNVP